MALTYEQRQLIESCYGFADFALATGIKSPLIAFAWDDFRGFVWDLMKQEESYNMDGIITEAFERWSREQTVYDLN